MMKRKPVPGFTIDCPDAWALDDAIWVEKTETGWIVHVTVADVASQVRRGSDADCQAHQRAFTRYYADGTSDHMLPRQLVRSVLSLYQGRERKTLTISVPISFDGEVGETTIEPTVLESIARLSYADVDAILLGAGRRKMRPAWNGLRPVLQQCMAVAELLLAQRRARGVLSIYDIATGFAVGDDGVVYHLAEHERYIGFVIVQEIMVLANTEIARYVLASNMPALYRNHEAKLAARTSLDLRNDIERAWRFPRTFDQELVRQHLRLVMKPAVESPVAAGHFSLKLPVYMRFTSPIRRLSDYVNQRVVWSLLTRDRPPYTMEELWAISDYVNTAAHEERLRRGDTAHHGRALVEPSSKSGSRELITVPEKEAQILIDQSMPELPQEVVSPTADLSAPATDETDFVVLLERRCHALGCRDPVQTIQQRGPSFAPMFHCSIKVSLNGQVVKSDRGIKASRRVKALQLAAENLLQKLPLVDGQTIQGSGSRMMAAAIQ